MFADQTLDAMVTDGCLILAGVLVENRAVKIMLPGHYFTPSHSPFIPS